MQPKIWGLIFSLFIICIFPGLAIAEGAEIQLSEKVTDQTTVIKGITFPHAKVTVENNEGILKSVEADSAGDFATAITKQPANTILKISASVGEGHTYTIEVLVAATGWVEESGLKYFYGPDGEKRTGWLYEGGKWYFLDSKGVMKTGWVSVSGTWYYLSGSGQMQTGWVKDANRWYYLRSSGAMQTGWLYEGGKWYFLGSNGAMVTGWLYEGGKWYYLGSNGAMMTGWIQDGIKWYFLNSDGSMKTGWVQSGKDRYFLGSRGYVSSVLLDVPLVAQMPELPRGCEVTSLAMMLMDAGKSVSKMTLASQVRKDPTPYSKTNGQVYFGNPYTGFVGDMYSFNKPGLGVYHGPIAELAEKYLPGRVVDFTGSNFEEIYKHLDNGKPVWVINNTWFDTVPSQYWQTWNTPTGKISITYKEHSVLITGYDSQYIYFNDPLSVTKNRKATISAFKRGWEQMGKQAISYR